MAKWTDLEIRYQIDIDKDEDLKERCNIRSEANEKAFADGFSASEANIPLTHCPHPRESGLEKLGPGVSLTYDQIDLSHHRWELGWNLSKLIRIQNHRINNEDKIRDSIKKYKTFESTHIALKKVIREGVLKHPFKYYSAQSELKKLWRKTIADCPEVIFLRDLYFATSYDTSKDKDRFYVEDISLRSIVGEESLRGLVTRYGTEYGARDAWNEYIRGQTHYTDGYGRFDI